MLCRFKLAARLFGVALLAQPLVSPRTAEAGLELNNSAIEVQFDIAAQPLADALVAFGSVTGLQVFYDGALAVGYRSTAVKGLFTPMLALQLLLRGTGYMPRATDSPDTITIVSGPQSPVFPPQAAAQLRRYDPYFAILQARVTDALCDSNEDGADGQVIFSIWVDSSGVVSRAEVIGEGASVIRTKGIAQMQGRWIGAPPAGLPQPVTMVILPHAANELPGCAAVDRRRAAH